MSSDSTGVNDACRCSDPKHFHRHDKCTFLRYHTSGGKWTACSQLSSDTEIWQKHRKLYNYGFDSGENVTSGIEGHVVYSHHTLKPKLHCNVPSLRCCAPGGSWITPAVQIPKSRVDLRPLGRGPSSSPNEQNLLSRSPPPLLESGVSSSSRSDNERLAHAAANATNPRAAAAGEAALKQTNRSLQPRAFRRRWAAEKPPMRKKQPPAPASGS